MAMKMTNIQKQIQRQSDKQMEIESIISKTVKEMLPEVLNNLLQTQILPKVMTHIKGVEKSVHEEVLPFVEQTICKIMEKQQQIKEGEEPTKQQQQLIRQLIVREFKEALEKIIAPQIGSTMKMMVEEMVQPLDYLTLSVKEKF